MEREFNIIFGMDEGLKTSGLRVFLLNDETKQRMRDQITLTGEKETENAVEERQLKFDVS